MSLDEELTVASCAGCGRTGHLSRVNGEVWCAWCGRATELTLGNVRVLTRETADRHTVDGRVIDPENVPLQPLRIPAGWRMAYNNAFYEVDPTPSTIPWWWIFKSDMLTLIHDERRRLLDLGWSPEGDVEEGRYRLVLHEGDFHGELLHEFESRDREAVVVEIESILRSVTEGRR